MSGAKSVGGGITVSANTSPAAIAQLTQNLDATDPGYLGFHAGRTHFVDDGDEGVDEFVVLAPDETK